VNWIGIRMLTGNPGKCLSMMLGVAFAALLIAQQASIFCGLIRLTASQIRDVRDAPIWVMDPHVQFIDDIKPLGDNALYRVRGVAGVGWAVRFYKGLSRARLPGGEFQQVILVGLDDSTPVGAPTLLHGRLEDLRQPDAVIMDQRGARTLWPDDPFRLGREFEMNDHRAVLVGICDSSRTFQTFPIVFSRYSAALQFVPPERKVLTFILAAPKDGTTEDQACQNITDATGLKALTRQQFIDGTIGYYVGHTGIPINFGITVLLGFVVGTAVAGQTLYLFTIENLRQFGTLKALGVSNRRIVSMVLCQASLVGVTGYALGVGMAAVFGQATAQFDRLAFFMPWQVLVGTGVAVVLIVVLSGLICVRRVLSLEPATVFAGPE
jgi:putative ABC transport system permease protein